MKSLFSLLSVCLLCAVARADTVIAVDSPPPDAPTPRSFWTLENKMGAGLLAGLVAADGITTQRGIALGCREMNPLMRPFVTRGAAGETAGSALGLGVALGSVYLLHRSHHYKLERYTLRFMVAGEGAIVGNNIAVLR